MYRDKNRTNFFNQYDSNRMTNQNPRSEKNLIEGVDWSKNTVRSNSRVFNPYGSTGDPLNYDASEKSLPVTG